MSRKVCFLPLQEITVIFYAAKISSNVIYLIQVNVYIKKKMNTFFKGEVSYYITLKTIY